MGVGWKLQRDWVLPLLTKAIAVPSVFVEGKFCTPSSGDGHGPHNTGNRAGLFSAAKMLHNDLWIGTED